MDCIDELVKHCSSLDLNSLLGLYDTFNFDQILIDCIYVMSKIYDAPYETKGDVSVMLMLVINNPELKDADYYATFYINDVKFDKLVPIRTLEIMQYLSKRYEHIENIIQEIDI